MMPDETLSRERLDQKRRTREAILAGARRLMDRGQAATVAAAAAEAGVSKATAYRYFADPASLAAEVGLAVRIATYEEITGGEADLRARLLAIALYLFDYTCENEVAFRQFLARHLDASLADRAIPRGARRATMYRRALAEDGALPETAREPFVCALSMVTGVEAMLALCDVAGLDHARAREVVRVTAGVVIDHHLAAAA